MSLKWQERKWVNKGNIYGSVSALPKMLGFWWRSAKSALKMWPFIKAPASQWRVVGLQDCFSEKCSVCLSHSCLLADGSYSVYKSSNRAIQGTWESKSELEANSYTACVIGQCCYVCRQSIDEVFCSNCLCILRTFRNLYLPVHYLRELFLLAPYKPVKVNSWCDICIGGFFPLLSFSCSLNILYFDSEE